MKDRNRFELILMIVACVLEIAALVCVIAANVDRVAQLVGSLKAKLTDCSLFPCCCKAEDDFDEEFEDWDL